MYNQIVHLTSSYCDKLGLFCDVFLRVYLKSAIWQGRVAAKWEAPNGVNYTYTLHLHPTPRLYPDADFQGESEWSNFILNDL